jgi:MFS superfamily sulfate permease-like transporter
MIESSPAATRLTAVAWGVLAACVTVVAYLLLLGWNAKMELTPEEPGAVGTECTGPHEPWQVATLAVVLAVLVIAGAWCRHEYVVPSLCVITLTLLFTLDAVTVDDPCADNSLLGVGVVLLLAGSSIAATVLAVVTVAVRDRRLPR